MITGNNVVPDTQQRANTPTTKAGTFRFPTPTALHGHPHGARPPDYIVAGGSTLVTTNQQMPDPATAERDFL